jgi:peptidoglycan/LPS O-acetylase OafA/YrhL
MTNKTYRPDIDGLRAVAVLAVLFNHAGFEIISGGFVGVDIFFVISGYLITQILYTDITKNRFSITSFYQRRARRILPAFYLVSFATVVAGSILMLPDDFEKLISSFIASSFFVANIFFMDATSSYFSADAHEMPFLQMWSLSVEEQFYVFWPLLLLFLTKKSSNIKVTAIVITFLIVVSFGTAEYWLDTSPNTAYYSIISRAGELLFGALIAVLPHHRILNTAKRSQFASILGLFFLAGGIFLIDDSTPFPGLHALWPCIGSALLICAGANRTSIGYRLLAVRPMVFVGLMSYSLYLWHWPLLAFTRYMKYEISTSLALSLVTTSIIFAYLSWKYVEQPFRGSESVGALKIAKIALTFITVAGLSTVIASHYGLVSLQSFDEVRYEKTRQDVLFPSLRNGWCHIDSEDGFNLPFEKSYLGCSYGSSSARHEALLWGDSHAASFAPFLDYLGESLGFSVVEMSTSGCAPSLTPVTDSKWNFQGPICNGFRSEVIRRIQKNEYNVIFIAARWEGYPEVLDNKIADAILFAAQHSHSVYVLEQVPRFDLNIGDCYVRGKSLPFSKGCNEHGSYQHAVAVDKSNNRLRSVISAIPNVYLITLESLICEDDACSPFIGKHPIYFDSNHLNIDGSRMLARKYLVSPHGRAVSSQIEKTVTENILE